MSSSHTPSFYWYDLETSGTDPRCDRVMQFAGVRTDLDLNEIDEPYTTYVKLPIDVLPNPASCLITGLTPQFINEHGIDELRFFSAVDDLFARPNTCVVGYNNLRFDDEFMRYGFYRHLIDPFAREWRNGNSRWDTIDLIRAAQALRPDGLTWPKEEGLPTFRLSALTSENGVEHAQAHDAASDVHATISVSRLIKVAQPRLFDFYLKLRRRDEVRRLLNAGAWRMCLHVSGMFPRDRNCIAPIVALDTHPHNSNAIIVVDLGKDVSPLLDGTSDQIREALFNRESGQERPGLKEVRVNKCPFVAPLGALRVEDQVRLGLDMELAASRLQMLRSEPGLVEKIVRVYALERSRPQEELDVDAALYQGFWGDADRARCVQARKLLLEGGDPSNWKFDDLRIAKLIWRIRARVHPDQLSLEERELWTREISSKLLLGGALSVLRRSLDADPNEPRSKILLDLEAYAESLSAYESLTEST